MRRLFYLKMLKKCDKSVNFLVVVLMVEFVVFFRGKNVEKNVLELSTSRGVVVMVAFLAFFLFVW